jgi:hypothetical protein
LGGAQTGIAFIASYDTERMAPAPRLFEREGPPGFAYRADAMTRAEEEALLDAITRVAFSAFEMRGAEKPLERRASSGLRLAPSARGSGAPRHARRN